MSDSDIGSIVSVASETGGGSYTIGGMTKEAFLESEKSKAIDMVKVASYRGTSQDPYPSPFLNLSDTKIPETSQQIFQWCKYFYMFDPLISGAINALAAFPVTEVYLEDLENKNDDAESSVLKEYENVLFKRINIHKLLIEIGIDYYLYGNCFVFGEMRINPMTQKKEWKTMVRLDPSKMTIDYNPATQEKKYKWEIPTSIARIVRNKKPISEYNKIPDIIKSAVLKKQTVTLNSNNVYHFARATDSLGDNNIWGTPVVANVLKLLMYRNTLRQAQEAIAREHIVPMRIYYLQKTDAYDPDSNWNQVAQNFAGELMKSVKDPNYKVVSPVPVNLLSVGGQGRALLLTPEIQQIQEEILAGMNIPREFIFGGISYSGSSISLKILENQFITYRVLLKDFIQNFVIKGMAKARKEILSDDDDNVVIAKMTDLKMQDDVQQKQLIINLNAAHKCTDEYMWKVIGIDSDRMKSALEAEAIAAVELQNKVKVKQMDLQKAEMKMQFELQKEQIKYEMELEIYRRSLMQEMAAAGINPPGDQVQENPMPEQQAPEQLGGEQTVPEQQAVQEENAKQEPAQAPVQQEQSPVMADNATADIPADIKKVALQLMKLPEAYRTKPLESIPPKARAEVEKAIMLLESAEDQKKKAQIDMRPMPEKLPPRRKSLS